MPKKTDLPAQLVKERTFGSGSYSLTCRYYDVETVVQHRHGYDKTVSKVIFDQLGQTISDTVFDIAIAQISGDLLRSWMEHGYPVPQDTDEAARRTETVISSMATMIYDFYGDLWFGDIAKAFDTHATAIIDVPIDLHHYGKMMNKVQLGRLLSTYRDYKSRFFAGVRKMEERRRKLESEMSEAIKKKPREVRNYYEVER